MKSKNVVIKLKLVNQTDNPVQVTIAIVLTVEITAMTESAFGLGLVPCFRVSFVLG